MGSVNKSGHFFHDSSMMPEGQNIDQFPTKRDNRVGGCTHTQTNVTRQTTLCAHC